MCPDLPELSGKQLQILREVIPKLSRIAVLGDPVLNAPQFRATEMAAKTLAMQVQTIDVRASRIRTVSRAWQAPPRDSDCCP